LRLRDVETVAFPATASTHGPVPAPAILSGGGDDEAIAVKTVPVDRTH
jgi:hypothetical protein